MSVDTKRKFTVKSKNGAVVIEYGMKALSIYERDQILGMILPSFPKAGETLTFEIKKVDK